MRQDHYLTDIITAAKQYDLSLNNKTFLFCYKSFSQLNYLYLKFDHRNFKHLLGIRSDLHPHDFYINCISHKLGPDIYQITNNTPQKLEAMKLFFDLQKLSASIGEPFHSRLNLQADIMVSKYQSILCLIQTKQYYFPQSLLNKVDPGKEMKTRHPILMTCVRDAQNQKFQITFLKKGISSSEIITDLPKNIQARISLDNQ